MSQVLIRVEFYILLFHIPSSSIIQNEINNMPPSNIRRKSHKKVNLTALVVAIACILVFSLGVINVGVIINTTIEEKDITYTISILDENKINAPDLVHSSKHHNAATTKAIGKNQLSKVEPWHSSYSHGTKTSTARENDQNPLKYHEQLGLPPPNSSYDTTTSNSKVKGQNQKNNVEQLRPRNSHDTTTSTSRGKSIMIIATVPNDSERKLAAIWSQLECYAQEFDEILIVGPKSQSLILKFLFHEAIEAMPEISGKLKTRFENKNIRHDAGLWCDALTGGEKGGGILEQAEGDSNVFIGGRSEYDRIMLINDSLLAVERTNEFLETLEARQANVVSLNYWGDQKDNMTSYWVESALRVFDLEGVQIFADKVCSLGQIRWKESCPYLKGYMNKGKTLKKCIIDKTEIEVASFYPPDKSYGLYPGNAGNFRSWTISYIFWETLRKEMSFPAIKTTRGGLYEKVRNWRPQDTERCTSKIKKWSIE